MKIIDGTLKAEKTLTGAKIEFVTRDFEEVEGFLKYKDKPMQAEIKPIRKKRSLDSNAYYWVLIGKLQHVLGVSKTELHNVILGEYGVIYTDRAVVLPMEVEYLKEKQHYRPIPNKVVEKEGKLYQWYWMVKDSHLYDSKEFSALIDGLISECKECGIETLPPEEIERMKQLYGQ